MVPDWNQRPGYDTGLVLEVWSWNWAGVNGLMKLLG